MVDVAKYFLEFLIDESCGKCVPCRLGLKRMQELLEEFTGGKGTLEDLDELELPRRGDKGRLPLRPGRLGAQSGAFHPALFPGRIRGSHPGPEVSGRGLQGSDHLYD